MIPRKIGIVSLYYKNSNMGGLLQAYALQTALSNDGLEAEQISYDYNYLNQQQRSIAKKLVHEQVTHADINIILKKAVARFMQWKKKVDVVETDFKKQMDAFQRFEQMIPHTSTVYNSDTIAQVNDSFDGFVCGSDIVWHPSRAVHTAFYLGFVGKTKIKLPYAVSMGRLPYTPLEKEMLKRNVQDFSVIATREQSVADYIASLTGKKTLTVVDPTLLLTAEQWESIEDRSCVPEGKYIFCYLFNNEKWCRKYVADYAKKVGMTVVYLPYIMNSKRKVDDLLSGIGICNAGPDGFIALIHHAQCVFTDSFHATVFSTLFQKEFYVFDRDPSKSKTSINSRNDEFLKRYGLEDHHIGNCAEGPLKRTVLPSARALEKIAVDREASYKYLQNGLNGTE